METYLECTKLLDDLLAGAREVRITVASVQIGTGWSRCANTASRTVT